jgi:hypothetical protein
MFDETLDVYHHEKVHIDIDPNAKPVHFYASPSTSNPSEDFQKGKQQSMLDQQLTSTEQSHETSAISIDNNH